MLVLVDYEKLWDRCLTLAFAVILIFAIAYPVNLHGSQPISIPDEAQASQSTDETPGDQSMPPGDSVLEYHDNGILDLQKQMHLHKQLEQSHTGEQYREQHRNNTD